MKHQIARLRCIILTHHEGAHPSCARGCSAWFGFTRAARGAWLGCRTALGTWAAHSARLLGFCARAASRASLGRLGRCLHCISPTKSELTMDVWTKHVPYYPMHSMMSASAYVTSHIKERVASWRGCSTGAHFFPGITWRNSLFHIFPEGFVRGSHTWAKGLALDPGESVPGLVDCPLAAPGEAGLPWFCNPSIQSMLARCLDNPLPDVSPPSSSSEASPSLSWRLCSAIM